MKPEIKNKWLKALRSGDYKQTTATLRRVNSEGESFCCLGVLCEIHRKTKKKKGIGWKGNKPGVYGDGGEYIDVFGRTLPSTAGGVLSEEVIKWAGLDNIDPRVDFAGKSKSLSSINDGKVSFTFIADLIEHSL